MKRIGDKKTGGRQKGSLNKVTSSLREWIDQILRSGQDQFLEDMKQLDPSERVRVFTSLLNYAIPKQQPYDPTESIREEYRQLSLLLDTAPHTAVNRIAERIETLKEKRDEQKRYDKENL